MRLPILLLSLLAFGASAGEVPWLTYRVYHGELALRDPEPLVAVHLDGRVEVYVPAWRRGAGRYEYELGPTEFEALVAAVTDPAVTTIDLAEVEFVMAQIERRVATEERVVYAVSDPDTYHVEINASAPAGSRTPSADPITLVWGMKHPALVDRAVPAWQSLENLRDRLQALVRIDGARRIGEASPLEAPGS